MRKTPRLAQLVEREDTNHRVAGSIPSIVIFFLRGQVEIFWAEAVLLHGIKKGAMDTYNLAYFLYLLFFYIITKINRDFLGYQILWSFSDSFGYCENASVFVFFVKYI